MSRIQHVTVTFASEELLEALEDFYLRLGGSMLVRPPKLEADTPGRWFGFGEVQLHLVPGPGTMEPAHFAIEMAADYEQVTQGLAQSGFEVKQARDLWGSPRCFVHDPAGNLIELFKSAPPALAGKQP
ncbi:MAG: VOC family protein [Actinomycetota bacterium]